MRQWNTEKERLEYHFEHGLVKENELDFGRIMPFGKYKGKFIYHLLVKHWRYMDWICNNTKFKLTEDEIWWKCQIDLVIELSNADRIISGVGSMLGKMEIGSENLENPHQVVE